MGNTHGMISSDINLPRGVTRMRKPASFYYFKTKPVTSENRGTQQANPIRKLASRTVTFYMMQQPEVGLPT